MRKFYKNKSYGVCQKYHLPSNYICWNADRCTHIQTPTYAVCDGKLWLWKANTVSYSNDQLYGCQKTLKPTRYKALMVSPLLYVTKHCSNGFIIGLWVLLCERLYSNVSKLCVLANPFPICVFEKQTLSQSRTRSLSPWPRGKYLPLHKACIYLNYIYLL